MKISPIHYYIIIVFHYVGTQMHISQARSATGDDGLLQWL